MNTLSRHALVAATAALAVAGALTMVSQDVGAAAAGSVGHAAPSMGEAMLVAAADALCAVVSGS